jgi:ABC-type transport system involved in multi-copper enzyme maturation permease subunit
MSSKSVIISAWAVPVMVIGQFAMLAIVPVALVLAGTLRKEQLRPLRWWAAALAAIYATPLVLWAIGPDRAPSLSKDMHPVFVVLISAVAAAVIAAYYVIGRRASVPEPAN